MKKFYFNKTLLKEDCRKIGLIFTGAGIVAIFSSQLDSLIWSTGLACLGIIFSCIGLLEEENDVRN